MLNIQYAAQQGIAGFPHVVFKVPAAHIIFFPPGGEPHPFLIQRRYSYKVGPGGGAGTGAAAAVVELKTDAFFLPEIAERCIQSTVHLQLVDELIDVVDYILLVFLEFHGLKSFDIARNLFEDDISFGKVFL